MSDKTKKIIYNDRVYCVSRPEGAIVVRRNGRVAISGNCMEMRGAAEDCRCKREIS